MIVIDNLWFGYHQKKPVLKGINLCIGEGELTFILGDNGSGKTTLLKHLNGLLKPNEGTVEVDGLDTRTTPVSELARKISIVFQQPEKMFYSPTVEEEVINTLSNFNLRISRREIINLLKEYGLEQYLDGSPYNLSGGEQRILTIAIMNSWNPKYLVLDEPTVGLDGIYREKLRILIGNRLEKGYTTIVATHDIEFALLFNAKLVVIHDGRIVYEGHTYDLINNKVVDKYGLILPTYSKALHMMYKKGILTDVRDYCGVFSEISVEVYRRCIDSH